MASVSATGGRERAWASGSVPWPAACSAAIPARTISSFSAWTPARPPARAIAAKALSNWASGMRGKRWGWVSKVESLNAAAPASTRSWTSSIGPRGGTVAHRATSMTASRSTSATLASNAASESIGPAAS